MTLRHRRPSHWATDFDHADPAYNPNAHAIWDELRDGGARSPTPTATAACGRRSRTARARGRLRHGALHEQRRHRQQRPSWYRRRRSAGAAHHERSAVPSASPGGCCCRRSRRRRSSRGRPRSAACATSCSTASATSRRATTIVDAAVQYAQNIPVNVIARMLGFPAEDDEMFRGFVHNVIERVDLPARGARSPTSSSSTPTSTRQVEDHVANPRDDLTSYLLDVELDGQPLRHEHVRGSIVLLLVAGIDTTWSAIGSSLLAPRHARRRPRRLIDDPDVMLFARRGVPAGLCARHDGAARARTTRVPRLPDEGRRVGAAAVPGGEPRPGASSSVPTRS